MDHMAIDYFETIAATDKTASWAGCSTLGAKAINNEPVNSAEQVYLQFNVIG